MNGHPLGGLIQHFQHYFTKRGLLFTYYVNCLITLLISRKIFPCILDLTNDSMTLIDILGRVNKVLIFRPQ